MYIWLRHITDGEAADLRVNAIDLRSSNINNRLQRTTLRDSEVDHLLSRKRQWELLIGADAMVTPESADFIEDWLGGEQRFICLNPQADPVPDDEEFIAVVADGGQSPRQYLDDHEAFPYYQFTIRQKRRS